MTDREMLLISYGAMKANYTENPKLREIVNLIEDHLFTDKSNEPLVAPEFPKDLHYGPIKKT